MLDVECRMSGQGIRHSTLNIHHSAVSRALVALLIVLTAPSLFAWGEKGHQITTEAAALTLPNDLPRFFYDHISTLVYLCNEPDRWRGGGESIEAENPPNHFFDWEYGDGLTLPRDRYAFIALMFKSGRLHQHGITPSTAGFLPWRIAELSEQLTTEWRLWRATRPGSPERAEAEREIVETAGLLSHYAGDASNPMHATLHFNGWADADNPHGYANDCDVHSRFEAWFVNRAAETQDVVPKVAAPKQISDAFKTAVAFLRESNSRVEDAYQLDKSGGFDPMKPVRADAKAFLTGRLAAGSSLLRDLWWSAWVNSAQSRRRGTPAPVPAPEQ
jgi:hypothetical protein